MSRRPSACPQGHPVRRNGERWWCWTCDTEVAPRAHPKPSLKRTRVKPIGPARKRARTRERHYGTQDRMDWLHSLPCVGQGAPTHVCDPWHMDTGRAVIQSVHVRARGAGGGADDQVPGCAALHREAGEWGTEERRLFEARTGLDLAARAADYAEQWRAIEALRDSDSVC